MLKINGFRSWGNIRKSFSVSIVTMVLGLGLSGCFLIPNKDVPADYSQNNKKVVYSLHKEPFAFPKSLPKHRLGKLESASSKKVVYQSKASAEQIVSFYRNKLSGTGLVPRKEGEVNQGTLRSFSFQGWPGRQVLRFQIVSIAPGRTTVVAELVPATL